jgi:hypothetical protein
VEPEKHKSENHITHPLQLPMPGLYLRIFSLFTILVIVTVENIAAFLDVCGASFERDVMFDGVVPNDEHVYLDSIAGLSRVRCCLKCHERRPNCVGVLYNRYQRKCKLMIRHMNEISQSLNFTTDGWQNFQKSQSAQGLCRNSFRLNKPWS